MSGQRETDVAVALGLPVKRLRALRAQHLNEGEWRKEGAAVVYTPAAVACVRALLGLAAAPTDKETPPPAALTAVVTRTYSNPKIVGIRVGDKEGRLRVRDARMFRRGMECPVRLETPPDLYVLTCRSPRWPGKF